MFFWNSLAFWMIQWMLAIWSLVPLPLLKPASRVMLTIPQAKLQQCQSWLKLMSIELVMPSNHLILSRPLLLLPSIFASIRVFSNESALRIRWAEIGASASAPVLRMNIQDWFLLGLTGLISLQSKGLSRVFSNLIKLINLIKRINSSVLNLLCGPTLTSIHDY